MAVLGAGVPVGEVVGRQTGDAFLKVYIRTRFPSSLSPEIFKKWRTSHLEFLTEQIIAGDVDEVLRRLLALIEETGPFGTLVLMSYDWDDKPAWLHSMELFVNELMPALNQAVCGAG